MKKGKLTMTVALFTDIFKEKNINFANQIFKDFELSSVKTIDDLIVFTGISPHFNEIDRDGGIPFYVLKKKEDKYEIKISK